MILCRFQFVVFFLGPELLEELIGSGKIKMEAVEEEEKLMKFRIGLLLVLDQQHMSSGITVPKIYIVLDLKEWCVLFCDIHIKYF